MMAEKLTDLIYSDKIIALVLIGLSIALVIVTSLAVALPTWYYVARTDRCARYAEINPARDIKYDEQLGCIIKRNDGLWIQTTMLRWNR